MIYHIVTLRGSVVDVRGSFVFKYVGGHIVKYLGPKLGVSNSRSSIIKFNMIT